MRAPCRKPALLLLAVALLGAWLPVGVAQQVLIGGLDATAVTDELLSSSLSAAGFSWSLTEELAVSNGTISMPNGGEAVVSIPVAVDTSGSWQVEVVLQIDNLPAASTPLLSIGSNVLITTAGVLRMQTDGTPTLLTLASVIDGSSPSPNDDILRTVITYDGSTLYFYASNDDASASAALQSSGSSSQLDAAREVTLELPAGTSLHRFRLYAPAQAALAAGVAAQEGCGLDAWGDDCSPCPDCGAHGVCNAGLVGVGSCVCDANWRHFGNAFCNECDSSHFGDACNSTCACGPHGACDSGINGAGCVCDAEWALDADSVCTECAFGFIRLTDPDINCVACLQDEDSPCNSHGSCTADLECSCTDDYFGELCSRCPAGRYGFFCQDCPVGMFGSVCGGHGVCSGEGTTSGTGVCVCDGFWGGDACDTCAAGRFGSNCDACPPSVDNPCNGHGSCDGDGTRSGDGSCSCDIGWAGDNCTSCAAGYFGPSCSACPPTADSPCSGHGSCDGSGTLAGSGTCTCTDGWTDESCSTCSPGWYGDAAVECLQCPGGADSPCSGHGTCDRATGICACEESWQSDDACSACAPGWGPVGQCTDCLLGFYGSSCTECTFDCVSGTCGGSAASEDVCICNDGWTGDACDTCLDNYFGEHCTPCSTVCENGICGGSPETEDECTQCDAGWTGDLCDDCLPTYFGEDCTSCSISCGHGSCGGSRSANDSCICDFGWTGITCDDCEDGFWGADCRPCVGGIGNACNSHGSCSAGDGSCTCDVAWAGSHDCATCAAGYGGDSCSPCPGSADNPCSAHGSCSAVTGACTCEEGWAGLACSLCDDGFWGADCLPCPGGAATPCTGHGECDLAVGVCGCLPNWDGDDACARCTPGYGGSNCTECPGGFDNVCSAHGSCPLATGECDCLPAWAGNASCSECSPDYFGDDCAACPTQLLLLLEEQLDAAGGEMSESEALLAAEAAAEEAGVLIAPCSGHGSCWDGRAGNGSCACLPNWSGDVVCSTCTPGFGGDSCTRCPLGEQDGSTCGGHGQCSLRDGSCTCSVGWQLPACDRCDDGFGGDDCHACPRGPDDSGAASTCSAHGACQVDSGDCLCDRLWDGDAACSSCTTAFTGGDCESCHVGYGGENCTACPGGPQLPCHAHGSCLGSGQRQAATMRCECEPGWQQPDCRLFSTDAIHFSLLSAAFQPGGGSLLLNFSAPSDGLLDGRVPPLPCTDVLTNTSAALLGTAASCRWLDSDPSLLEVTLGGDATLLPASDAALAQAEALTVDGNPQLCVDGASLWLRAGAVVHASGLIHASGCASVLLPEEAQQAPVVSLTAPASVGGCQDVLLDARRSSQLGPRRPTTRWSVLPAVPTLTEVLENATSTLLLRLPRDALTDGAQYVASLEVTSFLHPTAVRVTTIFVARPPDSIGGQQPIVTIAAGAGGCPRVQDRFEPLLLRASAEAACGSEDSVSGRWLWSTTLSSTPLPELATLAFTAPAPGLLLIPAGTLAAGGFYQLSVRPEPVDDSSAPAIADGAAESAAASDSGLATCEITVRRTPLVASFAHGEDRVVGADEELLLDAGASYDPDGDAGVLLFSWACSGYCQTASDAPLYLPAYQDSSSSPLLRVPPGVLTSGASLSFTVTVRKADRSSSAAAHVTVAPGTPPSTSVAPVLRAVNEEDSLLLRGSASSVTFGDDALVLQWSLEQGQLADTAGDETTALRRGGLRGELLFVAAGALRAGGHYTFRMTATAPGDLPIEMRQGAAAVSFTVNDRPVIGRLLVSPSNGTALSTAYLLEAPDWWDADLPLLYLFGHSQSQPLSTTAQLAWQLTTELPPPQAETLPTATSGAAALAAAREAAARAQLELYVAVSDAFGATSRLGGVHVGVARVREATARTVLQEAAASSDSTAALAALSALSALLPQQSPCAFVFCGQGSCAAGLCVCDEGWTAANCTERISFVPIDGGLGPWSPWSSCSVPCGIGTQTRQRSCTWPAPAHGGADCSGQGETEEAQRCERPTCSSIIHGNWSPWSPWSPCSEECDASVGGRAPGTRNRTRSCDNPPPSAGGNTCAGEGEQVQPCNLAPCPFPLAACPADCSGHGSCLRSPPACSAARPDCVTSCRCLPGWAGKACQLEETSLLARQQLRGEMVAALATASAAAKAGGDQEGERALHAVASQLATITSAADELGEQASADAAQLLETLLAAAIAERLRLMEPLDGASHSSSVAAVAAASAAAASSRPGEAQLEAAAADVISNIIAAGGDEQVVQGCIASLSTAVVARSRRQQRTLTVDSRAVQLTVASVPVDASGLSISLGFTAAASAVADAMRADGGAVAAYTAARMPLASLRLLTVEEQAAEAAASGHTLQEEVAVVIDDGSEDDDAGGAAASSSGSGDGSQAGTSRAALSPAGQLAGLTAVVVQRAAPPSIASGVRSGLLSVNFLNSEGEAVEVDALDRPARLRMSVPADDDVSQLRCVSWDEASAGWSTTGIISRGLSTDDDDAAAASTAAAQAAGIGSSADSMASGRLWLTCDTLHFSQFAAVLPADGNADSASGLLSPDSPILRVYDFSNPLAPLFMGFILVTAATCGFWAWQTDAVDARALDDFRLALFAQHGRFDIRPALRGPVANAIYQLAAEHPWLSILAPPSNSHVLRGRPQRVAVLLAVILMALAVTALLYAYDPDRAEEVILTGVVCGLAISPLSALLPLLFRASNRLVSQEEALEEEAERKLLRSGSAGASSASSGAGSGSGSGEEYDFGDVEVAIESEAAGDVVDDDDDDDDEEEEEEAVRRHGRRGSGSGGEAGSGSGGDDDVDAGDVAGVGVVLAAADFDDDDQDDDFLMSRIAGSSRPRLPAEEVERRRAARRGKREAERQRQEQREMERKQRERERARARERERERTLERKRMAADRAKGRRRSSGKVAAAGRAGDALAAMRGAALTRARRRRREHAARAWLWDGRLLRATLLRIVLAVSSGLLLCMAGVLAIAGSLLALAALFGKQMAWLLAVTGGGLLMQALLSGCFASSARSGSWRRSLALAWQMAFMLPLGYYALLTLTDTTGFMGMPDSFPAQQWEAALERAEGSSVAHSRLLAYEAQHSCCGYADGTNTSLGLLCKTPVGCAAAVEGTLRFMYSPMAHAVVVLASAAAALLLAAIVALMCGCASGAPAEVAARTKRYGRLSSRVSDGGATIEDEVHRPPKWRGSRATAAATTIQRVWRGWMERKRTKRRGEYASWQAARGLQSALACASYAALALVCCLSLALAALYAVKFTLRQARAWALSAVVCLFIDAVIQQPLMLACAAILRGLLTAPRSPMPAHAAAARL